MRCCLVFFSLLFLNAFTYASQLAPKSCQPIEISKESILLHSKKPALMVLVHNRSTNDLWITQSILKSKKTNPESSHLGAGKWSALIIGKKTVELSCIESKPGHEQQTPCLGIVDACKWPKLKIKGHTKGWVSENLFLGQLLSELGQRGFKVANSSQASKA